MQKSRRNINQDAANHIMSDDSDESDGKDGSDSKDKDGPSSTKDADSKVGSLAKSAKNAIASRRTALKGSA